MAYDLDFSPPRNEIARDESKDDDSTSSRNTCQSPVKETNLVGSGSAINTCTADNTKSSTAHVNDIDFKFRDADLSMCPNENLCSNSVFYTDVEPDPGESGDDVLLIEDLNITEPDEVLTKSKQMLAVTKSSHNEQPVEGRGGGDIEGATSCTRSAHKPKLWSCFPTKSNGPYRGPSSLSLSQPYLPLERQLSLRKVNDDREDQMRR